MAESALESFFIDQGWAALAAGNDAGAVREPVEVDGPGGDLPSHLPVQEVAVASISIALLAASALHRQRGGSRRRPALDRGHVAASVRSERYFRYRGQKTGFAFAPLSRFWRTLDGWVRTHANYPWHRTALISALGTSEDASDVAAALAAWHCKEVEETIFAAGGVAGAVRSAEAWQNHDQGRSVAAEPLVGHRRAGDAPPRIRPLGDLPASGIRVLDLTRVIAGPVCTRYVAALGADVLRLDPSDHPDLTPGDVADTLLGKRSAFVDLRTTAGSIILQRLLEHSDVVVCGYRPGALERLGLSEGSLAYTHPGLVLVYIDAWGHTGPWAARRGFDSVVQASTGIAEAESLPGGEPGALPCQLLDHGTGYLAAAAALDGLARQGAGGGTHVRRLSLARTAAWLMATPPGPPHSADRGPHLHGADGNVRDAARNLPGPASEVVGSPAWLLQVEDRRGAFTAVRPPGRLGDVTLHWPRRLSGYGLDAPTW
jgi:hypothetical protein